MQKLAIWLAKFILSKDDMSLCNCLIANFENLVDSFHCCIYSDRPSTPGKPELDFIDETTVKITWSPPADDGGSSVIAYVLEKMDEQHEKWISEEKVDFCSILGYGEGE